MARALTGPELTLLRSNGPWSKLYLAILKPNTIYTARLASLPGSTDLVYEITFTSGSGTLADVKPGMTLYVGSTLGAYDLGMCCIRKNPISGTFYIRLTSAIVWQGSCYLTVVDDFELWAKHAILVDDELIMDVDVAYSDQHEDFNPVPILGSHAVAKLESATVDVQLGPEDGDASWVIGSTISSILWVIPDAVSIDDATNARPIATFDSVGNHVAYCTVTAANGKTTTGVRQVFIWDDENPPATVFQLAQAVADYQTGGWMFDLVMEAEASLSEIRDRSLVALFAEDIYGIPPNQVFQSIGPLEGRENIVCVGRIMGESIRWDRESGLVHFTVQGAHHFLNKIKGFPIELSFVTGLAAAWSEMPVMTVDRVLFHLLYWHSTVIETMDFYPTNDTNYLPEGKSMASMVWGQMLDIAMSRLVASPGVDRFGRLFVEIDPQMVPEADRDWPTVMALTDDDWQEGIDLQRVIVNDVSLIRLSTHQVNSSGVTATLYSLSPGHTPMRHGEPEMADRLLAASQSDANSKAGLLMGWRTNQFPDVPMVLAQNNRMIDLWPRQFCALAMQTTDNPREVAFDGNLIPRRITFLFDGDIGYLHAELNFEAETFEQISVDGDIPDLDGLDISFPPEPELPPLPDFPILLPGDGPKIGPKRVLFHDPSKGFIYCKNFYEDSTKTLYATVNSGLSADQRAFANFMFICPNGAFYVGRIRAVDDSNYTTSPPFIARAPFIGATFTILYDEPAMRPSPFAGKQWGLFAVAHNPLLSEKVAFIMGTVNENKKFWIGSGSSFAPTIDADPTSFFPGGLSFGKGYWLYTRDDVWATATPDGTSSPASGTESIDDLYQDVPFVSHVRASTTGRTFHTKPGGGGLVVAEDNLSSITTITDADFPDGPGFACDPTGNYLMTRYGAGARGKSSDAGATWATMGSLPVGIWTFQYAGDAGVESRWIAAGAVIRYTPDFGVTWENKESSSLNQITFFPEIDMIRVVEF
jgi:hypothetical protein